MDIDYLKTKIKEARNRYNQLILIVTSINDNKVTQFEELCAKLGYPYINLSLKLAQGLLNIPIAKRPVKALEILYNILKDFSEDVLFLDNIELLFTPELKLDPLKALQPLSRNKTLIVSWCGLYDGNILTYAQPNHPEYQRYTELNDFEIICFD